MKVYIFYFVYALILLVAQILGYDHSLVFILLNRAFLCMLLGIFGMSIYWKHRANKRSKQIVREGVERLQQQIIKEASNYFKNN